MGEYFLSPQEDSPNPEYEFFFTRMRLVRVEIPRAKK
jgi:hypothetical protein